jgi:hypothetical protein
VNALPLDPKDGGDRFPSFHVISQAKHWDAATRKVVEARLAEPAAVSFFTPAEAATATALFDQLLFQRTGPRIPVMQSVDTRLAEGQTDGWHYSTMPTDASAWRQSLAGLDIDASEDRGTAFVLCDWEDQSVILQAVQDRGSHQWHGMVASYVWSLWTRYACAAFYAHPWAWDEIGFAGPAYPRGYKNLGVDRLEPFEVRDAHSGDDPVGGQSQ